MCTLAQKPSAISRTDLEIVPSLAYFLKRVYVLTEGTGSLVPGMLLLLKLVARYLISRSQQADHPHEQVLNIISIYTQSIN